METEEETDPRNINWNTYTYEIIHFNNMKTRYENNYIQDQLVSDFPSVFQEALSGLPPDRGIRHEIDLKVSVPKACPKYCLTPQEDSTLKAYLDEALKKGLIKPAKLPFGATVVMNDISILVLKTQELNPSSLKADQTLQDSPGPANLLIHRLKLLNYSATCRPTTEDSLNSCQSAAKLVPTKTYTYKGDVTWLTEIREGPTANLPRANTEVSKSTLETLESNPDSPKATQVPQSGQEPAHLLN
ncbi:hypothetical protein DSO57_1019627 [Entomophthora muscae]|uniref:Uncharacterized protein n=1 Tax=Entomophthora muscae TaxID=34485 RepID=A0ACC2SSW5_9FUNG|nr:hypothetical protein DSO57_1019627 [Entomophthora muscae]